MKTQTSIVLVTWNSRKHIKNCLESIENQTCKGSEIIVVDNNSRDGVLEYIQKSHPNVKIIQNKENLGFCKASNQGIHASQGEFILILNPDVFPEPDFLGELVRFLSGNPHYGSVGGKLFLLRDGKKSNRIDSTGLFLRRDLRAKDRGNLQEEQGRYNKESSVFAVCGAAVLFRREALERSKVEGEYFDENFFAYYDDLDLGWRIQLSGYENGYTPNARAYHIRGGSGAEAKFFRKSYDMQKITLRNRYLMLIKNLSLANLFYFFPFFFLSELMLLTYIFVRSPRLFTVYIDVGKNLTTYRKKRAIVQSLRTKSTKEIRNWIKRAQFL